ncbi:hypothetical protein [Alkanindiges illinoisensis]|uniref:hypothetical protein n=1 Tax=Alkanindiges illinoisensis TaxID=197183 RepID=UPI0004791C1B|nr:hypothetical protein [Alkanindiges illinoisensis]
MALQKMIKLAIFLVIALVVFNVLKKQSFFKTEPSQISSDSIPTPHSDGMSETQIQNEQIKSQLHHLNSSSQMQYIAGCMKTPTGCKCYDARAKPVEVSASTCASNVRDASANQHKAFDRKHN